MSLTPELVAILASALAVLVGSCMTFGHRYSDKCDKFDEKSRTDEVNEIRIAVRSENTVPAIDDLWKFLVDADREMKKEKLSMEVPSLFYDIKRRKPLNKLVNNIEQTFRNSERIGEVWDNMRSGYGQLGKILYLLAAVMGFGGYALLVLGLQPVFLQSEPLFTLLCVTLILIAILLIGIILIKYMGIHSNQKIYQRARKKYLIDEVRIE